MTRDEKTERRTAAMMRAQALIAEALDLLDGQGGPPEAAAHLELALQELRSAGAKRNGPTRTKGAR